MTDHPNRSADSDRLCIVAADLAVLRTAVQEACDLLAERAYGNGARSPGHNARLVLERGLKMAPEPSVKRIPDDAQSVGMRAVTIEECARVAENYPSSGSATEHPVEYWIRALASQPSPAATVEMIETGPVTVNEWEDASRPRLSAGSWGEIEVALSECRDFLADLVGGARFDVKADHHAKELIEQADAALTSTAPQTSGVWQPIDKAPQDGTRILATGGGLGEAVEVVTYNERVGCWSAETCTLDDTDHEPQGYNRPTLWQPMPSSQVSRPQLGGK